MKFVYKQKLNTTGMGLRSKNSMLRESMGSILFSKIENKFNQKQPNPGKEGLSRFFKKPIGKDPTKKKHK
jgi:hypothetical protein